MLCEDCPYFHIRQEPLRDKGILWDLGLAECGKHNLVVDFVNHRKFKTLKCVEDECNEKDTDIIQERV